MALGCQQDSWEVEGLQATPGGDHPGISWHLCPQKQAPDAPSWSTSSRGLILSPKLTSSSNTVFLYFLQMNSTSSAQPWVWLVIRSCPLQDASHPTGFGPGAGETLLIHPSFQPGSPCSSCSCLGCRDLVEAGPSPLRMGDWQDWEAGLGTS